MNFLEALELMKQGKKVRRIGYAHKDNYFEIVPASGGIIKSKCGRTDIFNRYNIEATDWVEYIEDDTWNIVKYIQDTKNVETNYPYDTLFLPSLITLKEKIIEDLKKTRNIEDYDGFQIDETCFESDIIEILDERFGF